MSAWLGFPPGHSPDVITGSIRKAKQLGNRREILLGSTESHRACDPGPVASVCPQGFAHLHWRQLSPSLQGQLLCLGIATMGIKPFLRLLKNKNPKKAEKKPLKDINLHRPPLVEIKATSVDQSGCCHYLSSPLNTDPEPFPSPPVLPRGFWGGEHPHTARPSQGSPCPGQIGGEEPGGSQMLAHKPRCHLPAS